MQRLNSLLLICFSFFPFFISGTFTTAAEAGEKAFAHRQSELDGQRYENYLKKNWKPGKATPEALIANARAAMAADPAKAMRLFALAAVANANSAPAWIGLARAALSIDPEKTRGSARYDLPVNAGGAAYIAYQRATSSELKADALVVLSQSLQRRSVWRPALEALKASLALNEVADVRKVFEKVRAEHGFRMTDYKTEVQTSTPRICLQFSETLTRAPVDFSKFVSVDGNDPQSVSAEGNQLCIEGLTHGRRYEIQLRAGLPSDVGENLEKTIAIAVYLSDRKPFARFTGRAYVLPSRGQQGIPVVSVNTTKVNIEVYRIGDRGLVGALNEGDLDRQLSSWSLETIKNRNGVEVFNGAMDVATKLNEEVTTAFPVSEAIGTLEPGVYVMVARADAPKRNYQNSISTQWFIVSDLGLTAFTGEDGVHGFVRSLHDATPVSGADVKLVARNNEVLATAKTDAQGYVRFKAGLTKGEGGSQPAILIARNGATDYAFLDLTTAAFDLSDRGVKGRASSGPIDGYVYAERGVYRPGERANITALVRDSAGNASNLPVTMIVTRPDGVEHTRTTMTDQGLGGRATELALDSGAMTGTWRVKIHLDPKEDPITQTAFLVEDFVPERLDMTLTPQSKVLTLGDAAIMKVAGKYLYGPPAADLALEGEIIVKPSTKGVPGFTGYTFGISDQHISPVRETLSDLPNTAKDGSAQLALNLPRVPKTARPLEATVLVRLRESGGRTIERRITMPVSLNMSRIGVKPLFEGSGLGEGETARFQVVMLNEQSKPEDAKGLTWTLYRLDTSWQWYSRDGSWSYEAVTLTRKTASGTIDVTKAAPAKLEIPLNYGRYRLEVVNPESDDVETSHIFSAGWYDAQDRPESPEMLDIALDKNTYNPGDTAKLRIATKHGGRALVTVLANGLRTMHEVEIAGGGGDVELKVGDDWGAGAYVTATLYRAMDEAKKRMPERAIGIKWLKLDQSARTLNVQLETADKIGSGEQLTVPVKITGLNPGEKAFVTIAAVDVGILNLTRYKAPNPEARFYAQTQLAMEIRDAYGRLIDGMRAERGRLRSGGDAGGGMNAQGSPPVEATVAEFSGLLSVAADGTASVSFDLPDFNGTVRVMAVAWTNSKLGHVRRDVIVRDPVALTASVPRFLTLGDKARIALSIHNVEGAAGSYALNVNQQIDDGLTSSLADRTIKLEAGQMRKEMLSVAPTKVGLHTYAVRVTGPGNIDVARELTIDVKPPASDIKRTTVTTLNASGGSLTVSHDIVHDLIPERTIVNLSVGPAARLDVPALLAQLDRYPYGCAEQTVSRALPLVYANGLAAQAGLATDKELKARVQEAVDRVFQMQDGSGAFGTWGPSNTNMWLTAYVTDFLTRAKESGYIVNPRGYEQALDRLQNFIAYAQDFKSGGEARAYALYVLSRNKRAPAGELRYYADTRIDRFTSPLAKAQIGAALAMIGDKPRAQKAFAKAIASMTAPSNQSVYLARADYGSRLRDGAALVALTTEAGVAKDQTQTLVDVVAAAYTKRGSYTSTQEQAWMLLAANALADANNGLALTYNNTPHLGAINTRVTALELEAGSVTVANTGEQPVDAVISVVGAALTPEPAITKGFKIERRYFNLDGTAVDLNSATGGNATLNQNQRLVAVLTITTEYDGGRVLLVDRLPAGFEIENPRLVDGGDIGSLSWLKTDTRPEHTEFRDDRFVAAFNLFAGNRGKPKPAGTSATVAYIVRAVTPGTFVHPAATVEDMYRPDHYARTDAGLLTISAAN